MSLLGDLLKNAEAVILLRHDVSELTDEAKELGKKVFDHEKRLIRIETMIEIARENRQRQLPKG